MRIVIELKRGEVPEVVLNNLYKHTPLQSSFGVIMLAIVGGRPKVLNLLELDRELRRVPPRRRPPPHRVRAAKGRGALSHPRRPEDRARSPGRGDHADSRIEDAGRGARRPDDAASGCRQIQAQAILDMQLQRLTGLERQKILDELAELLKTIERLRAILASERLLMQIIIDELKEVRTRVRRRSPHARSSRASRAS